MKDRRRDVISERLSALAAERSGQAYHRLNAATVERYLATIGRLPVPPASMLDVGCGRGVFVDVAAECGYAAQGLDVNAAYMDSMRSPHLVGSIDAIPLPDRAVDVVVAGEVLEHLPVDVYARAPTELSRVARDRVLITVPNAESLEAGSTRCPGCGCIYSRSGHVRRYERRQMAHLIPGFVLTHLSAIGPYKVRHRTIEWVIRRRLLGRWPSEPGRCCPQCGLVQPGQPGGAGPRKPAGLVRRVARFVASAPWQRTWLLAQYDRADVTSSQSS